MNIDQITVNCNKPGKQTADHVCANGGECHQIMRPTYHVEKNTMKQV